MITINNLNLSFGDQLIFDDVNLTINETQRIGLIGRNGTGKTTLLKLIFEAYKDKNPSITISSTKKIGYLPQEVTLESKRTILDEAIRFNAELVSLLDKQSDYEQQSTSNQIQAHEYIERAQQLQEYNLDTLKAEAKQVLNGLGFNNNQFNQSVSSLSVGWKMRIELAKLLLQQADFYLFDEPTNHLDIQAKDWFLSYLKNASFGFLIVSHERYFLNQLTNQTIELELGKATRYNGNFAAFEEQKEQSYEKLVQAYKNQQKEITRKQTTIDRFRAKPSKAKMVKSMIKELARMERIVVPPMPKSVHFNFPEPIRAGRIVLKVTNLSFSFNAKPLFDSVSFSIERGKKVAIIAANGVGKTTLLNVITGKYKPTSGSITFGHNVHWALFEQNQAEALHKKKNVLENIQMNHPDIEEQRIRTYLGNFLFSAEDITKKVQVLSGGEKNKVGMVNILLTKANLLFLDEPTNHLDMPSKDVLKKALQDYHGTILFVSHDHDFITDTATDIIELTPHGTHLFPGTYEEYRYYKEQHEPDSVSHKQKVSLQGNDKIASNKDRYELQKELKKIERKIEKLEKDIKRIEFSFAELEYGTPEYQQTAEKLILLKKDHEALFEQWEQML